MLGEEFRKAYQKRSEICEEKWHHRDLVKPGLFLPLDVTVTSVLQLSNTP